MKSRILQYLFYAFCFTIPLSPFINARLQAVLLVITLMLFGKHFSFGAWWKQSWDLSLLFLVLLLGLLYTTDQAMGWRQLETSLSLLSVPLLLVGFTRFAKAPIHHAFYAFAAGVLLASLICLGNALAEHFVTGQWSPFFYSQFTTIIDSHPTYLAYYLIFVITYGLYSLYYDLPKNFIPIGVGFIIYLFIILLLTGGQTAFISLLLTFSFFVSKYLLDQKTERTSLVALLVVILSIGWFALMVLEQENDRFKFISDQNDYWERMNLWESAIRANKNFWIGVGTGDYNLVLNDYYRSHNMGEFANENLNSHNQFIQLYFSNGIIGLMILFIILAHPLYLAVREQNLLGILLFFPFLVYGITEVFLGRYQGVVFLSFVHQLLITDSLSQKPLPLSNKS